MAGRGTIHLVYIAAPVMMLAPRWGRPGGYALAELQDQIDFLAASWGMLTGAALFSVVFAVSLVYRRGAPAERLADAGQ